MGVVPRSAGDAVRSLVTTSHINVLASNTFDAVGSLVTTSHIDVLTSNTVDAVVGPGYRFVLASIAEGTKVARRRKCASVASIAEALCNLR